MSIEKKLAKARDDYRVKLIERLDTLRDLIERLRRTADGETLVEAQRLAHRICGSAGTFGFTETGKAVAMMDRALLSLVEGQLVPSASLWARFDAALQQAEEETASGPEGAESDPSP